MEEYDPSTDTWSIKADMPRARESLSISVVNGKIYAIGGGPQVCSGQLSTVEEYDPIADSWSTKTNMQVARTGLSTSVVNGKIYALGGWQHGVDIAVPAVEEYDPVTDTWSAKAHMLTARAWFSACAVDDKIYVFGGTGNKGSTLKVAEYDPITDTWSERADMSAILLSSAASTVNGLIYIFGGSLTPGGLPLPDVREYNPISDTWSTISTMPSARMAACSSELDGKIYVLGGSTTGAPPQPESTVQVYTTPGVTSVQDPTLSESNSKVFTLHQNYPNPFNPETTIQYQVAKSAEVKLAILNLLGQHITTLVDEAQSVGVYSVQWDGKDDTGKAVASGVYLYRLQTNQFVQVKKLALLR
jgi:N-acetylneuraminic acid mutarotase